MKTRIIPALAATLALAACSNGEFIYGKALGDLSQVTGITTGYEESDAVTTEIAAKPAGEEAPLIVGFQAIRVAIPFVGTSGDSKTYVSPDGVVLAMNQDFVARATGIGVDLNGMYLPADSPWLSGLPEAAAAGARTDRVLEYWELGRLVRAKYDCGLDARPRAGGGLVIDETCKRYFEPDAFVNRYWTRADGSVECSRQAISQRLPPLQFFATEQQAVTLDLMTQAC